MVTESSESLLSFRPAEYYNRLLLVNDIPIQAAMAQPGVWSSSFSSAKAIRLSDETRNEQSCEDALPGILRAVS
jgi:hypothetical protein